MDENSEELGILGQYGVVVVPPEADGGSWLVTLASWNESVEGYDSGTDGPLVETEEEAWREAAKVLDWIAQQRDAGDLKRIWRQMQEHRGAEEGLDESFLHSRNPWNI